MKKRIKTIVIVVFILAGIWWLITRFVFRVDPPELARFPETHFEFSSSKPLYFKIGSELYCAMDGRFTYDLKPIWKGDIEETYISPNGKYAVIYNKNKLLLIDNKGKALFNIQNCTGLIPVDRDNGRFISSTVQWSENSDFFLVLQDKVRDGNFSKKNRSSIYKYILADGSFKSFVDLDEDVYEDFALSTDEKSLYYEFATQKGDLALKKIALKTRKVLSEHFRDDSLRLKGINADSIYFNYNKNLFVQNRYDLDGVFTTVWGNDSTGLYYKDKKRTVCLLTGANGYGNLKGIGFDFFVDGYFLPGSRFFIAYVSAKNFTGPIVIDTETLRIMKLKSPVNFYFNINSKDCPDFVFRSHIEPNVNFPTSVEAEIGRGK